MSKAFDNSQVINNNPINVKHFGAVGDGVADDSESIQAAVTYCFTTGTPLYWPKGNYLTTVSIDNLHSVRHQGPGAIKRGTDIFYPGISKDQTNTLYVSPFGTPENDGLSPSDPLNLRTAFDNLRNYGPVLEGIWVIKLAAGTYDQTNTGFDVTLSGVKSNERVVIEGPDVGGHPNTPTAIFDGTGGTSYQHGIRVGGVGLRVQVNDIKFQNFVGGNTRIGLVGENECDFSTRNIHAENCDWCGIYAFNTVRARISGGVLNNCQCGFISNATESTIGYGASNVSEGTIITNCANYGVYWSRGSQGHCDYCTFEDNAVGLVIAENSRVNAVGNVFNRNTYAIRTQTGGVFGNSGNIFGTASDSNTSELDYRALSGETYELAYASTMVRIAYDRTTRIHSGTGSTDIATVATIPAHRLHGSGKSCKVRVYGAITQVTAGSELAVKFGTTTVPIAVPSAATNLAFILEVDLLEVQGGYRSFARLEQGLSQQRINQAAGFDHSVDNDVIINANLAGAGDSITIYRTDVFIIG